jgi:hypothetical protein
VVWAGLLKESLQVVGWRPRLMLVIVHGSHDVQHACAARLPIVAIILVGRGRSPLRTLLVPPLASLSALLGALEDKIRLPRCWWHSGR